MLGIKLGHIAIHITQAFSDLQQGWVTIAGTPLAAALLEKSQARIAKGIGHRRDQVVKLAVAVFKHQLQQLLSQRFGGHGGRAGQRPDVNHGPLEQANHDARAVGAAIQHTICQLEKTQQQLQSQRRIHCSHRSSDGLVLGLQLNHQSFALARINKGGGTGQGCQALAHLLGRSAGTLSSS